MRVLVTGYAGHVGKIAVEYLLNAGAEVIGVGQKTDPIPGVEVHKGDVMDYNLIKELTRDCDTVVHLAAYTMPYSAPEQEIFNVNVCGTFNIFKACQENGVKRLTVASSPNAIGYNFAVKPRDISYLPVDGLHPNYTTDPYSFSKQCLEEVGQYFYRRYGISSVFMRFGLEFLYSIEEWLNTPGVQDIVALRGLVDKLLSMPAQEAAREVRRIENTLDQKRITALKSGIPYQNGTEYVYSDYDENERIWNYYVHNFLMFLDKRDIAEAITLSVYREVEGSHNLFIADDKNMLGIETAKFASLLYPGAKINYDRLTGFDAVVDYRTTEKIIGFRAKHSFGSIYGRLFKQHISQT